MGGGQKRQREETVEQLQTYMPSSSVLGGTTQSASVDFPIPYLSVPGFAMHRSDPFF